MSIVHQRNVTATVAIGVLRSLTRNVREGGDRAPVQPPWPPRGGGLCLQAFKTADPTTAAGHAGDTNARGLRVSCRAPQRLTHSMQPPGALHSHGASIVRRRSQACASSRCPRTRLFAAARPTRWADDGHVLYLQTPAMEKNTLTVFRLRRRLPALLDVRNYRPWWRPR